MITQVIDIPELSDTELQLAAKALSDPAVKKYLRMLSAKLVVQVYTAYSDGTNDPKFLRDIAGVQGQISALSTLLQISGE